MGDVQRFGQEAFQGSRTTFRSADQSAGLLRHLRDFLRQKLFIFPCSRMAAILENNRLTYRHTTNGLLESFRIEIRHLSLPGFRTSFVHGNSEPSRADDRSTCRSRISTALSRDPDPRRLAHSHWRAKASDKPLIPPAGTTVPSQRHFVTLCCEPQTQPGARLAPHLPSTSPAILHLRPGAVSL